MKLLRPPTCATAGSRPVGGRGAYGGIWDMGPGTFNLKAWSLGRLEGRRAEEMPIAFLPNDYPLMLRIPKGTWRVSIFR